MMKLTAFSAVKRLARIGPTCALVAVGVTACQEEVDPPVYQLIPITVRDIIVSASAAGVIEPVQTVEVKSKASGEIMDVLAEVGDRVSRGDLLVRVDQRVARNAVVQAEADLEVAQAQLDNAESRLRRSEALYETQSITEQEYENARLTRASAYASLVRSERSLEDARIAFEDTEVRAPSDGIILARNVEVGTVIQSASQGLSGGAVLLRMADLDTVQVRTLVDETDIGKIQPGLSVTIVVDAYPNQPFQGSVLKIEPEALEQQNVTMFPVLVRMPNERGLLRPGMNAEVEVHIGSREEAVAVPNAALRTQRDVASAAAVLGLDLATVREQLELARDGRQGRRDRASAGGSNSGESKTSSGESGSANTVTFRGREVQLPPGLTLEQVSPVLQKLQSGDPQAFQSLTAGERAIMARLRSSVAGRSGGRGPTGGRRTGRQSQSNFQFGGNYIVFVMRGGTPTALPVRTGLTDLDYSEVIAGLTVSDTVLVLPSASLIQSQQDFQERISRFTGGGFTRNQSSGSRQ